MNMTSVILGGAAVVFSVAGIKSCNQRHDEHWRRVNLEIKQINFICETYGERGALQKRADALGRDLEEIQRVYNRACGVR